jgi:hypothetical protein
MRLRSAVPVALGLAVALIGTGAFADPAALRAAGREAKCDADSFSRVQVMSDSPVCRRVGKNGRIGTGAPRLQFPQAWEMTAAYAWEAYPAPGLSAAVTATPQHSFTQGFANAGAGPDLLHNRPRWGAEPPPIVSFTGDVGIPNNHSLEDILRQQYRGPAAMENDSVAGKFVNAIGALKLGIKVDY